MNADTLMQYLRGRGWTTLHDARRAVKWNKGDVPTMIGVVRSLQRAGKVEARNGWTGGVFEVREKGVNG